MKDIIPNYYREYGFYVNQKKMLPSLADGLLPVQRRILLTIHTIAKNSHVKSSKVLGECMSRWHPHAEAYGTLQWAVNNGFANGDGNWGTKLGADPISAAAHRYTKVKADSVIEELAFKYVKYVRWEEDENDPEPIALPTMLPICLIGKYELSMIGFAFKTDIPVYKKEDLIKRLMYKLTKGKEFVPYPVINGCKILSDKKSVEKLLTTGITQLEIQGEYTTSPTNLKVYVRGWSPRSTFEGLLKKIDNYKKWGLLSNNDIGFADESTKTDGTLISFEVAKLRNKPEIFKKMKEAIIESLKSTISYKIVVVTPSGEIKEGIGVDMMIGFTFSYFKSTLGKYFESSIKNIQSTIKEYEIIKKLQPHVSDALKKRTESTMIEYLALMTEISEKDINTVVSKYKIKKLLTVKADVPELENEVKEFQKKLKNVDIECIKAYKDL